MKVLPALRAQLSLLGAIALLSSSAAHGNRRIGVGADLYLEGGAMQGEQWINNARLDESFQYTGANVLSATAYVLLRHSDRLSYGPGLRVLGNYAGSNGGYSFGLLNEALLMGEFAIPVVEDFEAVLGARAGLAVLVPGGDLSREIERLQANDVFSWSLPRLGFVGGLSAGTRRQMTKNLWLRADLIGQWNHLYLFVTDQRVDTLQFKKFWSTQALRLGLTVAAEVGF